MSWGKCEGCRAASDARSDTASAPDTSIKTPDVGGQPPDTGNKIPDTGNQDHRLPEAQPPDVVKPDITACGNGVVEPGEQCDGTTLGGKTCASLGYDGGSLSCNANCSFNTSACHKCGDGIVNASVPR